jgi:hypothetical protein
MYQIQNITTDALQTQSLILPDGSVIGITMNYVDMQQGWFFTSLTYGSFTINGLRITNSPNMLHQFRNQIPFGMACVSTDDREPFLITDFFGGDSVLYILTAEEVAEYTTILSAGV